MVVCCSTPVMTTPREDPSLVAATASPSMAGSEEDPSRRSSSLTAHGNNE